MQTIECDRCGYKRKTGIDNSSHIVSLHSDVKQVMVDLCLNCRKEVHKTATEVLARGRVKDTP